MVFSKHNCCRVNKLYGVTLLGASLATVEDKLCRDWWEGCQKVLAIWQAAEKLFKASAHYFVYDKKFTYPYVVPSHDWGPKQTTLEDPIF
jgi:hypothetical protein